MHEHSLTSAALTCQVAASCFSKPTALLLLCSLQAVQVLQQTGHTLMSGSALQDSRGYKQVFQKTAQKWPLKQPIPSGHAGRLLSTSGWPYRIQKPASQ